MKGETTLDNWPCYVCKLTDHLPTTAITPLNEVTSETTREDGSTFVTTATASATVQPDDLVISFVDSIAQKPTADQHSDGPKSSDDDEVPLWLVVSPSSASSTSATAEVTLEDQISVLYLEDSPLPLPPSTTPRSPYMAKLVSLDSSSEEELRSYLPNSPYHTTLTPPRLPVSPTPESQPTWSTVTDSPLSSPCAIIPENQRPSATWSSATDSFLPTPAAVAQGTPSQSDTTWLYGADSLVPSPYPITPATPSQLFVRNDSYTLPPPTLFLDINDDSHSGSGSGSDLGSPLRQIRKRLIEELKL